MDLRLMSRSLTDDQTIGFQISQLIIGWPDAITWTNVDPDLCRQMASLGHNESIYSIGLNVSHTSTKLMVQP